MTALEFSESPPTENGITSYDERHFVTYLRLLDADSEGAAWQEAVQIIFAIDPDNDLELAKAVHDNHLNRARWMTTNGYRHLLDKVSRGESMHK